MDNNKIAYIKGLVDGGSDNSKIFTKLIDMIEDLSIRITDLEEDNDYLLEQIDLLIDEAIEYEDNSDLCECDNEIDILDENTQELEGELFQVICPTCDECIFLDEAMLESGSIDCHICGENLEFDTVEDETEEIV